MSSVDVEAEPQVSYVSPDVLVPKYPGSGTQHDPYIVDWHDPPDPDNPKNWSKTRRWLLTLQLATGTFCVSFCSSSYTGGLQYTAVDLHTNEQIAILGVSLYVLGFALGPMIWAPLCEVLGRRRVFFATYTPFTLFHLGGALAHNVPTLLITRFLAGAFGSSPLTNAGGVIQDIWDAHERGVPQALYAMAPLAGPILGPIIGLRGYVSQTKHLGWRFNFWLMFIFSAVNLGIACVHLPETYAPILLHRRALKLQSSSSNGAIYISKFRKGKTKSFAEVMKVNMSRPFLFLFTEPIVMLLSIYSAIIYSILYAFFSVFPAVFERGHHFTPGESGLAFLGVGFGIVIGVALAPVQNKMYMKIVKGPKGAVPEARLGLARWAAVALPGGLFWFAWTTSPSVHYMVPIIAGIPFGITQIVLFVSISAYLIDTYTIFCASALAANVLFRSILGAALSELSPIMIRNLGTEWATSIFAFLSLACMPLPFLFFRYGPQIRARSKYASKLNDAMTRTIPNALPPPQMASATATPAPTTSSALSSQNEREAKDTNEKDVL